jgi:Asp-tRNA(Asn)/Glu-tRNA(Gln) amidotransferase C subunit
MDMTMAKKSQIQKFKELARTSMADEREGQFKDRLKRIARATASQKPKRRVKASG